MPEPTFHVEQHISGWDAFVSLAGKPEEKIGECYKTKASAINACKRYIKKYAPTDWIPSWNK